MILTKPRKLEMKKDNTGILRNKHKETNMTSIERSFQGPSHDLSTESDTNT